MKETTIAARYAKALFLVTERREETPRALEDLQALLPIVTPGTRAASLFASPEVRLADKRRALEVALEGRAIRSVAVFLDLLLRKRRLGGIAEVVEAFELLVERRLGIQRAHAVSAVPLAPAELDRLRTELERSTGHRIRLTTGVDPRLIGGAQVRIGDRVFDRSVRTLLASMARQLRGVSV